MKKIITLFVCAIALHIGLNAQCTINTGITAYGFTPSSLPCATQGVAYGQTAQVYVPSSYTIGGFPVTIDSCTITSITGLPAGISYQVNPVHAFPGGGHACIWYSGTTSAAAGTYPLTIHAAFQIAGYGTIDTTFNAVGLGDTISVCAPSSSPCTINTHNTTIGFTPSRLPCATDGVAYGQTVQVHVPSSISIATIDSVKLVSVTGLPSGITVALNPTNAIPGGGNGCGWFSGTTTAAAGNYPLTIRIIAYTNFGQFDTTLNGLGYGDTFSICGSVSAGCDTLINLSSRDTLALFTLSGGGFSGFLAGNNSAGETEVAEEFRGATGSQVTGAILGIAYAHIQPADSANNVTVKIYDASGAGGSPGTTIGTVTVTLRQIAYAVSNHRELPVSFTSGPTLSSHNFFISVVLPTTGDSIAFETNLGDNADGQGWANLPSFGGWLPYSSVFANPLDNMGNLIQAITCGGNPVASFQTSAASSCGVPATIQYYNTSSNGANTLSWSFTGGTPPTSTATNPTVVYSVAGSYPVLLTATGTGGSDSIWSTVNVFPAVQGNVSTSPATGSSSNGTAGVAVTSGTPPYTYLWNNQDTTSNITGLAPATYTVTITDADGCSATYNAVVTHMTGILEVGNGKTAHIYPNPATTVLNIDWNTATAAVITITDLNGKEIQHLTTAANTSNRIDISGLASGTYVLSLTDRSSNATQLMRISKQ